MTNGTEAYDTVVQLRTRGYPGESEQAQRNLEVCEGYQAGTTINDLAREFGISDTRVRQILDRRGLRVKKSPPTKPTATKPEKPSAYGDVRKKSVKSCTRCGREFTWIDTPMGWKAGDEFIPNYDPAVPFPHWQDSDGTRWVRHNCDGRNW